MKLIIILIVLTFPIDYKVYATTSQFQDTLLNYTQDSLVFETSSQNREAKRAPSKIKSKKSSTPDTPLFGNIKVAGTSTGTANPFVPKGYGTDPVDKYKYVLPQQYNINGSPREASREANKYDIDSSDIIILGFAIALVAIFFLFLKVQTSKQHLEHIKESSGIEKQPTKPSMTWNSTSTHNKGYSSDASEHSIPNKLPLMQSTTKEGIEKGLSVGGKVILTIFIIGLWGVLLSGIKELTRGDKNATGSGGIFGLILLGIVIFALTLVWKKRASKPESD